MNEITMEQRMQFLKKYGTGTRERFWKLGKMLTVPKGKICIRAREEATNINENCL